jgi:hypothetical protein
MATSIEGVNGIKLIEILQKLVLLVNEPLMKVSNHRFLKHTVILPICQMLANLLQIIIDCISNDLHQSQFLQPLQIVINLLRVRHYRFNI